MYTTNDISVKCSTKHLPLEYKLLEWKLIINRELYEEKIIDLKVFSIMEQNILGRITKIKNEYNLNNIDKEDDSQIGYKKELVIKSNK